MKRGNGIFAICDTETEYAFRFMEFLSHRKNIMFEIRVFTTAERVIAFSREHPIEILLISERSMCDEVAELNVGKLIILTETGTAAAYPGCLNIYKYQPSDLVVREIMEQYGDDAKETGQTQVLRPQTSHVIGVYTPAAFPQKMLLTLAMAAALGKSGRVLYVCLEPYSGFEAVAGQRFERSLSDLMYLFRQSGRGFAHRLNGMIYSLGGFDCLPPALSDDYHKIRPEEWVRFLEEVGRSSNYDVLILDIGAGIPDVLQLLGCCTQIFLPTGEDILSQARMREFETSLDGAGGEDLRSRMRTVVPPAPDYTAGGTHLIEKLPWTELGRFAASLCREQEFRSHLKKTAGVRSSSYEGT